MKSPSLPSCQESLFPALRGMGYIRFIGLILSLLLGIAGACRAEAAISTNKVVARVFARWLEQEAPQASAGDGKVARALAAALVKIADGGNVNARDKSGHTALMMAAAIDHRTAIDFLLLSGADPYIQNDKGRTALDMAKDDSVRKLMEASDLMDGGFPEEELQRCREQMETCQFVSANIKTGDFLYKSSKDEEKSLPLEEFLKWLMASESMREDVLREAVGYRRAGRTSTICPGNPDLLLFCLKAGMNPSKEYHYGEKDLVTTPLNQSLDNYVADYYRLVCQLITAGADVRKKANLQIERTRTELMPPLMITMYGDDRYKDYLEELLIEAGGVVKGDDVAGLMVKARKVFRTKANLMKALQISGITLNRLDDEATVKFYALVSPWLDTELLAYMNKIGLRKNAFAAEPMLAYGSLIKCFRSKRLANPFAVQTLLKMGVKAMPNAKHDDWQDIDWVRMYGMAQNAKGVRKHIRILKKKYRGDKEKLARALSFCFILDLDVELVKVIVEEIGISGGSTVSEYFSNAYWRNRKEVVEYILTRTKMKVGKKDCSNIQDPEVARLLVKAGANVKFESYLIFHYPEVAEAMLDVGLRPSDYSGLYSADERNNRLYRRWYPGESVILEKVDRVIKRLKAPK